MTTLFNVWHYSVFAVLFVLLIVGFIVAFKQEDPKLRAPVIFSFLLIVAIAGGFSIFSIDKYTKIVKLYKLDNKRLLSTEQIVYTGIVKNEGNYEIGEVTIEIKLVNNGFTGGNIKAGSFFSPSGFFDFFSSKPSGMSGNVKPQTIIKEFIVAKNLKPGESRPFSVYFDYPPYFRDVLPFVNIYGH